MTKHFDKINISNKRSEDESFVDYKERMKKNKIKIKMHLKGDVVWDSRSMGSYKRKDHGNI
tara:strand:+ start:3462 stop:3644 length:183 start_codon:yes stop_codon:yes gene_type:complete